MYDLSILHPDRSADFMATDPAFIDSVVQRDYQKYIKEGKVVVAKAATSNIPPPDKPTPKPETKPMQPMQLALF